MKPMSRRTILRGLGTAIALPWLEAMAPGNPPGERRRPGRRPSPKRMAFFYVPNGVHMPEWTPKGSGDDARAARDPSNPLAPFRDDLLVLTGLTQDGAFAHGDGGGDHARSLASFLTGTHPLKTAGLGIKAGVSVDQLAASKIGNATRFPSLELGIDRGAQAGNCDSGYSCAYSSNISWRSESTPMAKEINPQLVFERLFAGQLSARPPRSRPGATRTARVRPRLRPRGRQAAPGQARPGRPPEGRRVPDLGPRAGRPARARADKAVAVDLKGVRRPTGIPRENPEHIRLMFDVLALAFQTDSTRIATFVYANEGSTKSYKFIGVPEGHHDLSHHGKDAEKQAKIKKINIYHVEQFAYFLAKLRSIREGDGTVLDHSMIVYGSGISDGDRHNHDDLPILVAGRGGGTIKGGSTPSLSQEYPPQ